MSRAAAEVLKDALALPADARAALINSLLDSLDTDVDLEAEKFMGSRDFAPGAGNR